MKESKSTGDPMALSCPRVYPSLAPSPLPGSHAVGAPVPDLLQCAAFPALAPGETSVRGAIEQRAPIGGRTECTRGARATEPTPHPLLKTYSAKPADVKHEWYV